MHKAIDILVLIIAPFTKYIVYESKEVHPVLILLNSTLQCVKIRS